MSNHKIFQQYSIDFIIDNDYYSLSLRSKSLNILKSLTSLCVSLSVISLTHANSSLTLSTSTHSNSIHPYAPACEAVKPQSELLKNVQKQLQQSSQKQEHIFKNFWKHIKTTGTPYVEPIDDYHSRVIFLLRGAKHNARLIGGPSNDHEWLTRLKGSDIWFKESIVDNRFIGSYRFAIDVPNLEGYLSHECPHLNSHLKESRTQRRAILQVEQLDPYNPTTFQTKHNPAFRNENIFSLKDAPSYVNPQEFATYGAPPLISYDLNSKILNTTRTIQIYRSGQMSHTQNPITLIVFDGVQYAQMLELHKALDILVQQNKLPAIQVVFVGHPSEALRPQELTPNSSYSEFFKYELLPFLDTKLASPRDKQNTVIAGSSLGGLSSAYLALQFPEEISHVIPLSGSFWWKEQASDKDLGILKWIKTHQSSVQQHPQQWFISANTYESSRNNGLSILETSPQVAQKLKDLGHHMHDQSYVGGHSYAVWQVALQDALQHFFKPEN